MIASLESAERVLQGTKRARLIRPLRTFTKGRVLHTAKATLLLLRLFSFPLAVPHFVSPVLVGSIFVAVLIVANHYATKITISSN